MPLDRPSALTRPWSARRSFRRSLLAACLLVSFLQSWFFAVALVVDPDDTVHMFLGRLALNGTIGLYQDELPGHRAPLPYYFIGLSQALWDRNVVAGRLWSAALGLACFVLLLALTTRLAGELAGILALLFALSQGVIVGSFAHTSYHAMVSFLLLAGLYVALCTRFRGKRVLAMALFSLLFFTRTLVIPLIPVAMVYLLREARGALERIGIVAVTVVPPLVFFWSDPDHLKLLAYAPVLGGLVEPMGFRASPMMTSAFLHEEGLDSITRALALLARWYKVWILALVVLAAGLTTRALRHLPLGVMFSNRGVNLIGATLLYLSCCQFAVFTRSWSWAIGYLASFAILGAVWLGFGFSVLVREYCVTSVHRAAVGTVLAGLFLLGPSLSRPPDLPFSVRLATAPVPALYELSEALRTHISPGSHVFQLGSFQPLYIAGLEPYLRQVFGAWTLSPITDELIRKKSGLWGEAEIREWLERDAQYAVIAPTAFRTHRAACDRCVELIRLLLAKHFTQIAVLEPNTGYPYIVFKRSP